MPRKPRKLIVPRPARRYTPPQAAAPAAPSFNDVLSQALLLEAGYEDCPLSACATLMNGFRNTTTRELMGDMQQKGLLGDGSDGRTVFGSSLERLIGPGNGDSES